MENIEFEWDDEKAKDNMSKHGVSFEEGATIFNDPMIATVFDPDHSKREERYISMGVSALGSRSPVSRCAYRTRRKNSIDQLQKSNKCREKSL